MIASSPAGASPCVTRKRTNARKAVPGTFVPAAVSLPCFATNKGAEFLCLDVRQTLVRPDSDRNRRTKKR